MSFAYTLDANGNVTVSGGNANPYQFTSRENDGTGLDYYRGRYYSPAQQRFTAQDPLEFSGGDVDLYAYTADDPIDNFGPNGCGFVNCAKALADLEQAVLELRNDLNGVQKCGKCDAGHEKELRQRKQHLQDALDKAKKHCAGVATAVSLIAEAEALLGELEGCFAGFGLAL